MKRISPVDKELRAVQKQENRLAQAAAKARPARWREEVESRIPDKVYSGLESAFCKGFDLIFSQGRGIIEKSFQKDTLKADHAVRDFAVQIKGGRRELKQMRRSAQRADLLNLAVTTVEGIGLGALGIGMPDIVLFLANLMRGIYETALHYGFEYESPQEQLRILKMLAAALSSGKEWVRRNAEVDQMLELETVDITQEDIRKQSRETAAIFAMDMLLLKFIQGMPVVGILGGAANPVYYSKIMKYIQLKYRKRYLLKQKERQYGTTEDGPGADCIL